ncbi:hypothetical protein [uncultured Endozoicomonas sp.]|uniref:hypothetical protein n=1 Tax=uncultured Endozoicomonas sp. TaxID=432652 RepID=UPI002621AF1A|nr:hypothetical protein [uncultured Endozoicomonas sp.]
MSYQIPLADVDFRFDRPYTVTSAAIADFTFDGLPFFHYSKPPGLLRVLVSQWSSPSEKLESDIRAASNDAAEKNLTKKQRSYQAEMIVSSGNSVLWGKVDEKQAAVHFQHGIAIKKEASANDAWGEIATKDSGQTLKWDKSIREKQESLDVPWGDGRPQDSAVAEGMQSVDLYGAASKKYSGYVHPVQPINFVFDDALYTPAENGSVFFQIGEIQPALPAIPTDTKRLFSFSSNRTNDNTVVIPWGFGQKAKDEEVTGSYGGEIAPNVVEKPEPEQPDIRESYLLMNTITTVVLPDRIPLELPSLEISLDIDSFSWSFTGQLIGATNIAMVEPDENGPKQIEVDINGWKWIFIIERYSTDRRFGNERYTIYGSSRTQLLAAPYAPMRSKSNSSDLNAKQAISEELANTGFTASYPDLNDYSTPDWIMPGGSFSYQNQTAIQVVAKVAGTAGSVIIPSRDEDRLNIQPRYPASPWVWNTATIDKIVPASMVISLSASWRPEQAYNAVYVSGTNAGVAVNVKRQGTNGDNPAPDILEDWLTETQVNTERGRNELSKGGNQSITSIELLLTDTVPGLIEPGMLVEILDVTGDWRGLCLATSISASGVGRVVQSIELERHY